MNFKKIKFMIITSIILSLLMIFNVVVHSQDQESIIDPNIPKSWSETPKLTSEIGIDNFSQSPMLDDKVSNGEIPPVEERLPKDPPAIEPYEKIGEYGGTAVGWDIDLGGFESSYWNFAAGARQSPNANEIVPFLLKGWEYSNDYKNITLKLREDLKWSDGEPFTADDYIFWWEHVAQNKELTPTPPENWKPALLDVVKENKWEITFVYDRTAPHRHLWLCWHLGEWGITPAHYMKQFHPDFVGEKEAQEFAEEVGLEEWHEYFQRIQSDSPVHPEYKHVRPVLTPYIANNRSESHLEMERNPYYPFVDIDGNQLPYIDRIRINLANDAEMAATKATTGEATVASRHTKSSDIPLYKKMEEEGNYKTLLFPKPYGSEYGIQVNLTHKDLKLRSIFQDPKFRQALSLSIDRNEINNKVYFGAAKPRQATLIPSTPYFEKSFEEAFAEYDPERAKELLDDIGMIDSDNDGWRNLPEGTKTTMSGKEVELNSEKFNPQILYTQMGAADPTKVMELIRKYFRNIGLEVDIKNVSRELYNTRWATNEGDIGGWIIGQAVGPFFELDNGMRPFAPVLAAGYVQWPGWVNWYTTDGEEGIEPPDEIKKLIEKAEIMMYSPNEKDRINAGKYLLKAQADNLWAIGTVGMAPHPLIKNKELKNVPEEGLWGYWSGYMKPYHSHQFYFEN